MKIVIRIGGSVVASPLNVALIDKYIDLLKSLKHEGHDVAVVVGGGSPARDFIETAKKLGLSEAEQDLIAISVSRLIAQLFVLKLAASSTGNVPTSVHAAVEELKKGKIVVMGGLKPGMTTDAVAALIAEHFHADLLVKATDQEGVYTCDPRKYKDAKLLTKLSFEELADRLKENRHKAGIHQVLDPKAIEILGKIRIKTVVVNGFNPQNVLLAVKGEKIGTLIT
ncbi:MAG: UMP kinase [Candidatus Bathyarchaeia archaeon]